MKSLAQHMSVYAAYHRHPVNRAIHFVMVPAIVWTVMVALDAVGLGEVAGFPVSLALVVTLVLLAWYLMLDFALGLAGVAVFTVLLVTAMQVRLALGTRSALMAAGAVFVASWVFQFIGHGVWEKRRPALVDNLFQVFVAPMFLISEAAFSLGFKKRLEDEVMQQMHGHLPTA